ncbi:RNA polymerase sigma factor [Streptomyces sp. NPDC057074]|uniref:RNA polymerase sigma factor n=1 Tax=Streptomyces sp. NPDC057074 TaxID=3346015 RepID=UPI0036361C52
MFQQSACPPDRQQVGQDIVRHRDRLLALTRKRLPTRQDAEDCVQEAMIRTAAYPGLDLARVGPFLTTVALRLSPTSTAPSTGSRHSYAVLSRCCRRSSPKTTSATRPSEGLPVAAFAARQGISAKAAEGAYTRGRARLRALALREPAASAANTDAFVAESATKTAAGGVVQGLSAEDVV